MDQVHPSFEQSSHVAVATLSVNQPDNWLYTYILPIILFGLFIYLLQVILTSSLFKPKPPPVPPSVREINETTSTFESLLQSKPSAITSIYLNNQSKSPSFFEDRFIPIFLHNFASQITHLKVHHFETCLFQPEYLFYANLPNLEHLDITSIDASRRNCMQTYTTPGGRGRNHRGNGDGRRIVIPRQKSPFPENFKNLKTLKLNCILGSNHNDTGYGRDFIEFCVNLEYLRHPFYRSGVSLATPEHRGGPFGCVINYIEKRQEKRRADHRNLQFYDLEHLDPNEEEEDFSCDFCILVRCCYDNGVKLVNVHSGLLEMVTSVFEDNPEVYSEPLISLRNCTGHVFSNELGNLEKVVIESTRLSSYGDTWTWGDDKEGSTPPQWPRLKFLEVMIDSDELFGDDEFPEEDTEELLNFLVGGMVRREGLEELRIKFAGEEGLYDCVEEMLPVPRVEGITQSCPFLRRLCLGNWLGGGEDLRGFWEGLPMLEEVTLEECGGVGLGAFLDLRNGVSEFLKLKRLRKVELKGVHLMPGICDLCFKLVFRHLKVKEFCLEGAVPLTSITVDGIESLLSGQFGSSVERFSFEGWSLDGVSREEFRRLERKFRR